MAYKVPKTDKGKRKEMNRLAKMRSFYQKKLDKIEEKDERIMKAWYPKGK